jgi:hypothetical protein
MDTIESSEEDDAASMRIKMESNGHPAEDGTLERFKEGNGREGGRVVR